MACHACALRDRLLGEIFSATVLGMIRCSRDAWYVRSEIKGQDQVTNAFTHGPLEHLHLSPRK